MTLAELKGLAVCYMNGDPSVPLRNGVQVPRTFVLDLGVLGGLPGLRFGDVTWLLRVECMPGGLSPTVTGREVFLLVEEVKPTLLTAEVGRQFGWPCGRVRFYEMHTDGEAAVKAAATMAAGLVFIQKALAGEFQPARPTVTGVGPGPLGLGVEGESANLFEEISLEQNQSPRPPSVQVLREIGSAFVGGVKSKHSLAAWDDVIVQERLFRGRQVIEVDRGLMLAMIEDVPMEEADDIPEAIDRHRPGVVLVKQSRKPAAYAIAAALPSVPWEDWVVTSVHHGWFPAFTAAITEMISRRHEEEIRRSFEKPRSG